MHVQKARQSSQSQHITVLYFHDVSYHIYYYEANKHISQQSWTRKTLNLGSRNGKVFIIFSCSLQSLKFVQLQPNKDQHSLLLNRIPLIVTVYGHLTVSTIGMTEVTAQFLKIKRTTANSFTQGVWKPQNVGTTRTSNHLTSSKLLSML